jgi:hypothetical protein
VDQAIADEQDFGSKLFAFNPRKRISKVNKTFYQYLNAFIRLKLLDIMQ